MAAATLCNVQRAIDKAGLPLEIVRGEGYHYFVFDDPSTGRFDTSSEYVCYTRHLSIEQWVEAAQRAWVEIQKGFSA